MEECLIASSIICNRYHLMAGYRCCCYCCRCCPFANEDMRATSINLSATNALRWNANVAPQPQTHCHANGFIIQTETPWSDREGMKPGNWPAAHKWPDSTVVWSRCLSQRDCLCMTSVARVICLKRFRPSLTERFIEWVSEPSVLEGDGTRSRCRKDWKRKRGNTSDRQTTILDRNAWLQPLCVGQVWVCYPAECRPQNIVIIITTVTIHLVHLNLR